ncbi:hypothetical protein [Scytonema sp. NUACC21]
MTNPKTVNNATLEVLGKPQSVNIFTDTISWLTNQTSWDRW